MDVLSDLLTALRLRGAVFFHADFTRPWQVRSERSERLTRLLLPKARRLILFHYLAAGDCWAQVGDERCELTAGDVIVLPYGQEHVMGSGSRASQLEIVSLFPSPPPWPTAPRIRAGGGGEATKIVCGFLHCDEALFNPLLEVLPDILVVRADRGSERGLLSACLRLLADELQSERPGAQSVRRGLTELLFVEVLRQHIAQLKEGDRGWLAALADPGVGRALEAIHSQPEQDWSVEDLARRAAMSRSAFYARFAELLDQSPAQYVTRWRLQRAAHLLLDDSLTIAEVAQSVGYASEAAFSRAFKRHAGEPPSRWRRRGQ